MSPGRGKRPPRSPDAGSALPGDPAGSGFSSEELEALSDERLFRMRADIVRRLRHSLEGLRDRMAVHLQGGRYLMPEGADIRDGRIGRGEYLDEMPYLYLDFPRHFDGGTAFTFRTLFWWGHGISFSLILAGPHLPEYRRRLLENLGVLEALDVHVATAASPWDWRRGPGHSMLATPDEEPVLRRLFRTQEFLKCARFLDFGEAEFRENRIDEAALLTFRGLEPIILS